MFTAIVCILYSFFQRYRKHSRMNSNANRPTTPNELLQNFPNLKKVKSLGKILQYLYYTRNIEE